MLSRSPNQVRTLSSGSSLKEDCTLRILFQQFLPKWSSCPMMKILWREEKGVIDEATS